MRAILTFHSVDDSGSVISYPPSSFRYLLEKLSRQGMPVLSLEALLQPGCRRGVALTFDDGMRSVYQNALPVIREYRVPALIFVATSAIEGDKNWYVQDGTGQGLEMLCWDELKELQDAGVEIGSHTHNHPDLRTLEPGQITDECFRADELIETRLGIAPRFFAYPYGYHNKQARDIIRQRYMASVTTELKPLSEQMDSAVLPRLDSYYFRTPGAINLLDSFLMSAYLSGRNFLRNIKGSQCRPNAD